MGLRHAPTPRLPAGILPSREAAEAALLRVFSRARRRGSPLLLLRVESENGATLPTALLDGLGAQLRIGDLIWCEASAELLVLLDDTEEGRAVIARLREGAAGHGLRLRLHQAQFPRQGLTIEALLAEVGWRV